MPQWKRRKKYLDLSLEVKNENGDRNRIQLQPNQMPCGELSVTVSDILALRLGHKFLGNTNDYYYYYQCCLRAKLIDGVYGGRYRISYGVSTIEYTAAAYYRVPIVQGDLCSQFSHHSLNLIIKIMLTCYMGNWDGKYYEKTIIYYYFVVDLSDL